jgi:nicotinamidase/pyrazinamidase
MAWPEATRSPALLHTFISFTSHGLGPPRRSVPALLLTLHLRYIHLSSARTATEVGPYQLLFSPMHALLLIDIQNDFLPGGALAVAGGDEIIPEVNSLMNDFEMIVATQDWHPLDHGSFAVNHPGKQVFESIDLEGLPQTLWPVHCVQQTGGALFAPGLDSRRIARVFPKGTDARIDSYSGFFDNGHRSDTGLADWLRGQGVSELTLCGLATDYCVKFTALDALQCGFKVNLHLPACRGVDLQPGDCERAVEEMCASGVSLVGMA